MQKNGKTVTNDPSLTVQQSDAEKSADKPGSEESIEIKSVEERPGCCSQVRLKIQQLLRKHPKTGAVFSKLSITAFLIAYNVVGAQVFVWLEQGNELQSYSEARSTLSSAKNNLTSVLLDLKDNLTASQIQEALSSYDEKLAESINSGVDVNLDNVNEAKWSLLQSIFFASTILTTVGYGNISPVTDSGKIFCIVFALVGIPFTLVVLSDIGEGIAKIISFLEKKFQGELNYSDLQKKKQSLCHRLFTKGRTLIFILLSLLSLFCYIAFGSLLFMYSEKWTFLDSFYFCFITVTTIGFGDFVPTQTSYMLACTAYILVGLALTSTIIEMIRLRFVESLNRLKKSVNQLLELSSQMGHLVRKVRDQVMYGDGSIDVKLIDEMMKVQRQIDQVQAENGTQMHDSMFDLPAHLLLGPQLSPSFLSLHSVDVEDYDNEEMVKNPPPLEWEHDWEDLWVRLESGERVSYRLMKIAKDYENQLVPK